MFRLFQCVRIWSKSILLIYISLYSSDYIFIIYSITEYIMPPVSTFVYSTRLFSYVFLIRYTFDSR
nr:MAG TPA: hypothetical protein [Caudoviricetes sp.]